MIATATNSSITASTSITLPGITTYSSWGRFNRNYAAKTCRGCSDILDRGVHELFPGIADGARIVDLVVRHRPWPDAGYQLQSAIGGSFSAENFTAGIVGPFTAVGSANAAGTYTDRRTVI